MMRVPYINPHISVSQAAGLYARKLCEKSVSFVR